ncbi:MAG: FUSC family protein [Acetobacteraceae bacterium]|nr:FUSC family protein [Acetobacteraceae bacterium]
MSVAALAFRLIPSLSPAFRTRRLLASTLRDLRHLAASPIPLAPSDWQSRIYGRFSALPDEAPPLQRSELLAALSVGLEIIKLRGIALGPDHLAELDAALEAAARGNGALAIARLADLEQALRPCPNADALQARSSILAVSEALSRHAVYFNADARGEVH